MKGDLRCFCEPLCWHLLNLANRHKVFDVGLGDLRSSILYFLSEFLHDLNQLSFDLPRKKFTFSILYSDFFKTLVVFEEESKVLERHIDA